MRLSPKNWDKFQQYKDRKPQWIKLQRDLLNDFSYASVRIGTKATLPLLWLLSSEYDDGVIDASVEEISFRIHIDLKTVQTAIDELLLLGFYSDLDADVQDCTEVYKMVPREEKRRDREETEKEEIPNGIDATSWMEWVQHRKEIKKTLTKSTKTKQLNFLLAHINDHVAIINQSIQNGWAGLFELKQQKPQQQSFKQQDIQRTDDSIDAFLEARDNGFDIRNARTEEVHCEVIEQK